jgi:hypothetical protein
MRSGRGPGDRIRALRVARAMGAIALLVVGGVHLEQYKVAHFSVIPTIGPLFLDPNSTVHSPRSAAV